MKQLLFALAAIVTLAVTGLALSSPAVAQIPVQSCQPSDVDGSHTLSTEKVVWDEERNSWVLATFTCLGRNGDTNDPFWKRTGTVHDFNTQERPDGIVRFRGFDRYGWPILESGGATVPVPGPPAGTSYWSREDSSDLERITSQFVDAATICTEMRATGRNPGHIYRVGGSWHHIENANDRAAFGRSDARMSRIWRSVPECR